MILSYYNSPIGILEIIVENDVLISLKLTDKCNFQSVETPFIKEIKTQLDEYFEGKRKTFDIKIKTDGTQFQQKVWNTLLKIPYGSTKSYSEIAEITKNKNASRVVGNACNKNPIMIVIPCHRVVSKNKTSGGFAYGTEIKNKLLELEN